MDLSEEKAHEEKKMMDLLARQIEDRMGRGTVGDWSQRDFMRLSDEILKVTREHLSVTTLKRVLGRVEYKGTPYVHTLNTLCQFLGFPSSGQFKIRMTAPHGVQGGAEPEMVQTLATDGVVASPGPDFVPEISQIPTVDMQAARPALEVAPPQKTWERPAEEENSRSASRLLTFGIGASLIILLVYLFYPYFSKNIGGSATEPVLTVEKGNCDTLPCRVNFVYTGPALESRNLNLIRFEGSNMNYVDTTSNWTTSYSFTKPGLYLVKIFSNRKTVAIAPVLIPSGGWQGRVEQKRDGKPLNQTIAIADQRMPEITAEDVMLAGGDTTQRLNTQLEMFKEFNVSADRFTAEMELLNPPSHRGDGSVNLRMRGEKEVVVLQFKAQASKGTFIQVADRYWNEKANQADVKGFKQGFTYWRKVSVSTQGSSLVVSLDGRKIFSTTYERPIGALRSIEVGFDGIGQMRNLSVKDSEGKEVL